MDVIVVAPGVTVDVAVSIIADADGGRSVAAPPIITPSELHDMVAAAALLAR